MAELDVICVGRAAVDLYAEQVGIPLEDVTSFAKYVGGCPGNISVGTSKLGLKSAMLTRVGDEPLGRFVRQALAGYGVDVRQVRLDPKHLTGLVVLGIQPPDRFPLLFFRENCADIHLSPTDIDPDFVGSASAIVLSGTGLSRSPSKEAHDTILDAASRAGTKVVLDLDWRPMLWPVPADEARTTYQRVLPRTSLVVGTEEEVTVAGGVDAVRRLTPGVLVMKRGPRGCTVYAPGNTGVDVPGFAIEILNVLGAGDAFLSGFLRGWLRGWSLERSARLANAVGAIVVTRHGCAPAMPRFEEVEQFLAERQEGPP